MNADLMPGWMRALTGYNPVNWAVVAAREALAERPDPVGVWLPAVGLLLLAVLMVWLSTRTFRTYQKAV
jgi:ABC-2 type transport system permease protein